MNFNSSSWIILIVIIFAAYLIYNQNMPQVVMPPPIQPQRSELKIPQQTVQAPMPPQPQPVNVNINAPDDDPYSDPIKRQDLYTMYDPLTYPQLRIPRDVLEKYNEYFNKYGVYPPFGEATQPFLFDNPIMVGVLIKKMDENEAFADNIPTSVPLFRVRSSKNANRYFYYIIDQRYYSRVEQKIPFDHVRVNGRVYPNADFYGIPELFDDDIIENISIFPFAKFRVNLYKTYHFP